MSGVTRVFGNLFGEEGDDLFSISTRNVADKPFVDAIRELESLGQNQFKAFVEFCANKKEPVTVIQ